MSKQNYPKVIVSNAIRMHTHQLCVGLVQKNRLDTFYTTVWYDPNSKINKFLCALPFVGKKIKHTFLKRYEEKLPVKNVKTYPWFEIIHQIKRRIPFLKSTENWVLKAGRKFDLYVVKQIKKKKYDIFIGYETSCLNSLKTAKQQGKTTVLDLTQVHWKYIQHLRNKYPIFKSLQEDRLFHKISDVKDEEYKYIDYIFTLSTFAKETLVNSGIDEKKIYLTNLGFDPTKFKCKEKYRVDPDVPLEILFAGTVTKRKGIHLLLEAVKQSTNTRLSIVGPMADGIECLKQYEGYFSYTPFLHHHELAKRFQEADIFVFPSYLDSWAMVVLEAMASGTPVIVSENTGSKDVVMKGGGKIIPVDDLEALKSAIDFYQTNRHQIQKDGLKAHEIAQNFTWAAYHTRINQIISTIT